MPKICLVSLFKASPSVSFDHYVGQNNDYLHLKNSNLSGSMIQQYMKAKYLGIINEKTS